MNHYFTENNRGTCNKVFLPNVSVLKEESNPLATSNIPTHPSNPKSKKRHDVRNVDPEDTIHLIQQLSKKEGQSKTKFMSEPLEQHEVVERQDNKNKLLGKDYADEQWDFIN